MSQMDLQSYVAVKVVHVLTSSASQPSISAFCFIPFSLSILFPLHMLQLNEQFLRVLPFLCVIPRKVLHSFKVWVMHGA